MTPYTKAAAKYRPKKTRLLFVAEAPPSSIDRYFYFENVKRDDWLWIALMKELFPADWVSTTSERQRKADWLLRFKNKGCQLMDAVKEPIRGTHRKRVAAIEGGASKLIAEIEKIKPKQVILVKATVHEALFQKMKIAGLAVANQEPLPFPSSGRQQEFHCKFNRHWLG